MKKWKIKFEANTNEGCPATQAYISYGAGKDKHYYCALKKRKDGELFSTECYGLGKKGCPAIERKKHDERRNKKSSTTATQKDG